MSLDGQAEVLRNLRELMVSLHNEALAAADESAVLLETYAKQTAPFTDRTTNLRNSIKGSAGEVPGGFRIVVSGGMSYAPFVELGTSHSRAFAFLWPAVVANQDEILRLFARRLSL